MKDYTGISNLEVMREAENYNRFLIDLVLSEARVGDAIVDFGAGAGTFALPVAASGKQVTCVEPDATLSQHLSDQGLTVLPDLDRVGDQSVDYIYSLNVLEHIADDAAITRLWYRKLRPGGKLLVYVPAFDVLFSSMDRKVGHHRRYRMHGLRDMLVKAGFDIVGGRYVDSLGFVATLVFKAVDRGCGDLNVRAVTLYDRGVFPLSRILDRLTGTIGGKNVYLVARKPG
jgi:SAM-dependent methyltransferase